MRGIILFDNLNDLAFIDADDELTLHIQRLAFKDGLLQVIIIFLYFSDSISQSKAILGLISFSNVLIS